MSLKMVGLITNRLRNVRFKGAACIILFRSARPTRRRMPKCGLLKWIRELSDMPVGDY
jgi:hypothetical protein